MKELVDTLAIISFLLIIVFFVIAIIALVKKKTAKKWFLAVGASAILWIVFLMIPTCEHEWVEATCIVPKTCSLCEKTEGDVVEHTWVEANCTLPKHCSVCELTEGEKLDHTWVEATCAKAKHCSVCDTTDGEPLEHTWVEATCTKPKTCSVCKDRDGKALGHTYGEWKITTKPTAFTSGTRERTCSTCQDVETESYKLDSYVDNGKFIFTPKEFRDMFFDNSVELGSSKFGGAQVKTKDGQVMVSIIDLGYNNVGNIGFVANKNTWKMASSETESGFDGLMMMISTSDELTANSMMAMIMSCDPNASELDARLTAADALKGTGTLNDIEYTIILTGKMYTMTAVPVA